MRRFLLLLGPVAATAMLLACEDPDSSGGTNVFAPDGGTFEAGPRPEGGPLPEASPDAPLAPLDVTVTVLRSLGPAPGVTVVFHDAAGAVLEVKKTGADGKATSSGATPAQATALLGGGSTKYLLTWTALEAGDDLLAADVESNGSAGVYNAALAAPFAGGYYYRAYVGTCFGSATAVTAPPAFIPVYMDTGCVRPANSVLASVSDGDGLLQAYAFKKGVPPTPGDGGTASTTLGAWAAPGIVRIKPLNAPPSVNLVGHLAEVSEGAAFFNESSNGAVGRLGTADYQVATGFAEAYQAAVRLQEGAGSVTRMVARRLAPAASIDIDLATALPIIDSGTVDGKSPARPEVKWTTAAPLTGTDGGSVHLDWWDGRDENHGWSFVVAPGATSVKAPALPAEAAEWAPRAQGDGGVNAQYGEPSILFLEASILPSYAAFRREAGRIVPLQGGYDRDARAVLPANGELRTTQRLPSAR